MFGGKPCLALPEIILSRMSATVGFACIENVTIAGSKARLLLFFLIATSAKWKDTGFSSEELDEIRGRATSRYIGRQCLSRSPARLGDLASQNRVASSFEVVDEGTAIGDACNRLNHLRPPSLILAKYLTGGFPSGDFR